MNLHSIKINELYGFSDEYGAVIIQPQYTSVREFNEGLAAVSRTNDYWEFINDKGEQIIADKFKKLIDDFKNGVAIVGSLLYLHFINIKGEMIDLDQPINTAPYKYNLTYGYERYRVDTLTNFRNNIAEFTYKSIIRHRNSDGYESIFYKGLIHRSGKRLFFDKGRCDEWWSKGECGPLDFKDIEVTYLNNLIKINDNYYDYQLNKTNKSLFNF